MNILFLITRRQTRGAETFAVQIADTLANMGHRLVVASLYAPAAIPLEIPERLSPRDLSHSGPRVIPHFKILKGIDRLIQDEKIDIVQANASDNLKYVVLSQKLFNWKAPVVYRNASIMSAWLRSKLHRRLYQFLLDQTDAIASVSEKSRLDIVEAFQQPHARVHHIGIAVHPPREISVLESRSRLMHAIQPIPEGDREQLIFHIGAFTPEKNHAGLVRVFDRIQAVYPHPIRLICIGDGPLMAEAVREYSQVKISWLGYRNDVEELLPAADLLLLTSHIEGTPGVVLEAGINRVVPLSYRVGAVDECYPPEIYEELTVPHGDEAALAKRAIALLADERHRKHLAEQQYNFVKDQYTMQTVAAQFEQLYIYLVK